MRPTQSRGFVYAATGQTYVSLAAASASSLRAVCPDLPIHLWSDVPPPEGVFDAVHDLGHSGIRPKFEALRTAPFEQSIYLDADILVCADISDIFFLLKRFDIAGAHVFGRNTAPCRRTHTRDFPAAFPQINSGVLAIRRTPAIQDFLAAVDREMARTDADADQPIFRELLFESDLRLAVLPPEYNFKRISQAAALSSADTAPRVIHDSHLHRRFAKLRDRIDSPSEGPVRLEDIYNATLVGHIRRLLAADRYLNALPNDTPVEPLVELPNAHRAKKKRPNWLRRLLRPGNGA